MYSNTVDNFLIGTHEIVISKIFYTYPQVIPYYAN